MSNTDTCPAEKTLRDYLRGAADETQCEQIESHLSVCESCEETLLSLEGDTDTMIRHLRAASIGAGRQPSVDPMLTQALSESRKQLDRSPSGFSRVRQPWMPPTDRIGPYRLIRSIGSGGMGAVYLATHTDLGKQFAIKLLPLSPADQDQRQERFLREIRAAGSLDHVSIVTATDAGRHDDIHFLAMEYIDGFDLSRVAAGGRLSISDACEIIRQVAQGMAYAHAKGVVHRDLKPSNLMLRRDGEIKILDFGLAQMSAWEGDYAELTSVGQLMGTLDYMSPEQAEQPTAVDYRADLYSLGATLFRLIAGRPPLAATPNLSPLAKLRLLANHTAPRLDTLREDVPQPLVVLVDSLLSPDPEDRPASASHVAETLTMFTQGSDLAVLATEVAARPTTAPHSDATAVLSSSLGETPEHAGTEPPWRLMRWLWLALIPLLAIAAVVITLETKKGQLIIESDVPDVTVELVQDGKPVDSMEIQPGANSTRLRAGDYQVVIAAGSDNVTVDKESIQIRSGEVTVARITPPKPKKNAVGSSSRELGQSVGEMKKNAHPVLPSSNQPLQPGQRLQLSSVADKSLDMELTVLADHTIKPRQIGVINIKGKTLSEVESVLNIEYAKWYDDPAVELFIKFDTVAGSTPIGLPGPPHVPLSSSGKKSAVGQASLEPVYDEKTLSHWLNVIRTERENDRLVVAMNAVLALGTEEQSDQIIIAIRESHHRISTGLVTRAIRQVVPEDRMPEFLIEQLEGSDQEWAGMLVRHCDNLFRKPENQEAVVRWILDNVIVKGGAKALLVPSLDFCLQSALGSRVDTALRDRLISTLRESSIGDNCLIHPFYWLERASWKYENDQWFQEMIYDAAKQIVVDESTDPNEVSAALSALIQQRKSHIEMASVAQRDQELVKAVVRRLKESKRTQWSNQTPGNPEHRFGFPMDERLAYGGRFVNLFRNVHFDVRSGVLHMDPITQLLKFVDATSLAGDALPQLIRLMNETQAGHERILKFVKTSNIRSLGLSWQTMKPLQISWGSSKGPSSHLDSEDLPTSQDWFDSYVYMRAVTLVESVQRSEKAE